MSTNPNNAVGTNAAYGGRTSVNAFNDDLAAYSRGIISGWGCSPNTGLTVVLGGDGSTRDVAIAEDNAGNRTTINNISGSPVSVTIAGAPASNSRIDAIVAYVDNPANGTSTVADNPAACGLIVVTGTAAASPIAPTESAIRTAITADGASGTTAYYVVLATITIASGTTDLTASNITAGDNANISSNQIGDGTITADKIDFATFKQVLYFGTTTKTTLTTTQQNIITTSLVPKGNYIIFVRVALIGNGDTSAFDYIARVVDSSNNILGDLSTSKQRAVPYGDSLMMQSFVSLSADSVLYLKVWRNTGSGTAQTGSNGIYDSTNIIIIPIQ